MFYGCQPKKFFYEAAETVARSRHLKGKGIETEAKGSWSSVREAKNRFTDKIPSGTREEGIDFLSGQARFLDGNTLAIDGRQVRAEYTILATGARPMPLSILGEEHIITSDTYLDLENLPSEFFSLEAALYPLSLPILPFDWVRKTATGFTVTTNSRLSHETDLVVHGAGRIPPGKAIYFICSSRSLHEDRSF